MLRSKLSPWTVSYLGLVGFSLVGSWLSAAFHLNPGPIVPVASVLTLVIGAVAAANPFWLDQGIRPILQLGLAGAIIELCGIMTGFPFGRYAYTNRWFPALPLGPRGYFPLLLPLAWVLVVSASTSTMILLFGQFNGPRGSERQSSRGRIGLPVLTGLLAAIIDMVMEPALTGPLSYWHWQYTGPFPGGVPISNFLGWWATATLGYWILARKSLPALQKTDGWPILVGHLLLTTGIAAIQR